MRIVVRVHGQEMSFSEEELQVILEQYFFKSKMIAEEDVQIPMQQLDKRFQVTPIDIDRNLFKEERKDKKQEHTRKLILEAFRNVEKNPWKYGKPFKTKVMEKELNSGVFSGKDESDEGHIANWVEQALEWAQRIHNGESWETLCNIPDISRWYRIIIWKDGKLRYIGGSSADSNKSPATAIHQVNFRYKKSTCKYISIVKVFE